MTLKGLFTIIRLPTLLKTCDERALWNDIRWGIIGCGHIAKSFAKGLDRVPMPYWSLAPLHRPSAQKPC